jgi:hypothetical protein
MRSARINPSDDSSLEGRQFVCLATRGEVWSLRLTGSRLSPDDIQE